MVSLVGEANVGKTTIFNKLTDLKMQTGNWHGVTVAKKLGKMSDRSDITIVDLPGITMLDLPNLSLDEKCTVEHILKIKEISFESSKTDNSKTSLKTYTSSKTHNLVVNILSADNLSSGLYLTIQLKELGIPFIICINSFSSYKSAFDLEIISKSFDCTVIMLDDLNAYIKNYADIKNNTFANFSSDINFLFDKKRKVLRDKKKIEKEFGCNSCGQCSSKLFCNTTKELNNQEPSNRLFSTIEKRNDASKNSSKNFKQSNYQLITEKIHPKIVGLNYDQWPSLWHLFHYLEYGENHYINDFSEKIISQSMMNQAKKIEFSLLNTQENIYDANNDIQESIGLFLSKTRHKYAINTAKSSLKNVKKKSKIDKMLDAFLLHKWFSLPIFTLIIYLIFFFTISVGNYLKPFFEQAAITIFVSPIISLLSESSIQFKFIHIIVNGIGSGIQTIASFIPLLFFMYFSLNILETSGYMTRAAIVMDKLLNRIGLPGKAIIPLIIGFGCNVPAILSTRTLANAKQRIGVIMMLPFISCGARLAVFALFASIFFHDNQAITIWLLYITGIVLAIITGSIFKNYLSCDLYSTVTVLPHYKLPSLKETLLYAKRKIIDFIRGASKTIIVISLLLNILTSVNNKGFTNDPSDSIIAYAGKKLSWIMSPIGLGEDNWQASVSLLTGIFAKEVIIGSLTSLHEVPNMQEVEVFEKKVSNDKEEIIAYKDKNFDSAGSNYKDDMHSTYQDSDLNMSKNTNVFTMKESTLHNKIKNSFQSVGGAFSYMLFVLLYFPCISVYSVIAKEIGTKYAVLSVLWSTISAYILATLFYSIYDIVNDITISLIAALFIAGSVLFFSKIMLLFTYSKKTRKSLIT